MKQNIDLGFTVADQIYKIELGPLDPDPRIALRNSPAKGKELRELQKKLERFDSRARGNAWTYQILEILKSQPGVRAGYLCGQVDQEKAQFKQNLRKLKNLGLTESLDIGYRLSIRGRALLDD